MFCSADVACILSTSLQTNTIDAKFPNLLPEEIYTQHRMIIYTYLLPKSERVPL